LWAARPIRAVSGRAAELVERCFEGVQREKLWDTHVHLVGIGSADTGCWVNPGQQSIFAPIRRLRYDVFRAASGVTDDDQADQQYLDRLLTLHRAANPKGKLVLLAFDYRVGDDGEEAPELSDFYTPNEYVLEVAKNNSDVVACASVHPYRSDAVERLTQAAAAGARACKWLPNAMGIDPASPKCDPFYDKLAALRIPLITHGGEEQAVESGTDQELGNPLRLRRALEHGVRVVVAHCASLGHVEDLDNESAGQIEAFDAFMRLFTDRRWEKQLFADVSALIQVNRCGRPLREILISKDLHPRLVNGSDYPLPAIDPLVSTSTLVDKGYLTADERELLNAIFVANPLLFDFAVKRTIKVEYKSDMHSFSPSVFETSWLFNGESRAS
jgi:mannonate dehydratase